MEGAKVEEGGLESSLIQIIQEHQQRAFRFRDQADKAKQDALKDAVQVSELLVDTVNGGVEEVFINEKCVELEIRSLISTITRYRKQTNQWLAASHSLNNALKVRNPHNIKYDGTIPGLKYIWRIEGFRGLFKGNGSICARVVPNSAVKFFSYEQACRRSETSRTG